MTSTMSAQPPVLDGFVLSTASTLATIPSTRQQGTFTSAVLTREERAVVFSDVSGNSAAELFWACTAAIDATTVALNTAALSTTLPPAARAAKQYETARQEYATQAKAAAVSAANAAVSAKPPATSSVAANASGSELWQSRGAASAASPLSAHVSRAFFGYQTLWALLLLLWAPIRPFFDAVGATVNMLLLGPLRMAGSAAVSSYRWALLKMAETGLAQFLPYDPLAEAALWMRAASSSDARANRSRVLVESLAPAVAPLLGGPVARSHKLAADALAEVVRVPQCAPAPGTADEAALAGSNVTLWQLAGIVPMPQAAAAAAAAQIGSTLAPPLAAAQAAADAAESTPSDSSGRVFAGAAAGGGHLLPLDAAVLGGLLAAEVEFTAAPEMAAEARRPVHRVLAGGAVYTRHYVLPTASRRALTIAALGAGLPVLLALLQLSPAASNAPVAQAPQQHINTARASSASADAEPASFSVLSPLAAVVAGLAWVLNTSAWAVAALTHASAGIGHLLAVSAAVTLLAYVVLAAPASIAFRVHVGQEDATAVLHLADATVAACVEQIVRLQRSGDVAATDSASAGRLAGRAAELCFNRIEWLPHASRAARAGGLLLQTLLALVRLAVLGSLTVALASVLLSVSFVGAVVRQAIDALMVPQWLGFAASCARALWWLLCFLPWLALLAARISLAYLRWGCRYTAFALSGGAWYGEADPLGDAETAAALERAQAVEMAAMASADCAARLAEAREAGNVAAQAAIAEEAAAVTRSKELALRQGLQYRRVAPPRPQLEALLTSAFEAWGRNPLAVLAAGTASLQLVARSPAMQTAALLENVRGTVAAIEMLTDAVAASPLEDGQDVLRPYVLPAVASLLSCSAALGGYLCSPRYLAAPAPWGALASDFLPAAAWGEETGAYLAAQLVDERAPPVPVPTSADAAASVQDLAHLSELEGLPADRRPSAAQLKAGSRELVRSRAAAALQGLRERVLLLHDPATLSAPAGAGAADSLPLSAGVPAPRHIRPSAAALHAALITSLRRIKAAMPALWETSVLPRLPSALLRQVAQQLHL